MIKILTGGNSRDTGLWVFEKLFWNVAFAWMSNWNL